MATIRILVVSLGAIGLVLAANLGSGSGSPRTAARAEAPAEFGGISAQTATAATGAVDAGAAWFSLGPDGLRQRLSTR